jgi:hypothetical protein
MSSIISQSSCQNCNRINCYGLTIINSDTQVHTFTYQDCNNNTYFISLSGSQVSLICAKSNTLNFLYAASASLAVIPGEICGAAFSNYPYIANCKEISVSNNTTSSFDISYTDCTEVFKIVTVSGSTSSTPACLNPDTLTVGTFGILPTSSYRIDDFGYCENGYILSSFTKYCNFLGAYTLFSTGSGVPYSIQYQKCGDGTLVSASGITPGSSAIVTEITNQCIRSGSLVTSGDVFPDIVSGSLSYCGFYEDPTPYTGSRTPVEIQEYNYNRTGALRSKYEGAKSISAKYNVYTKGDQSYPGYAAADNYVSYTGLLTNVESSSYFPNQMVVKLAYFSDTSGGLNDLNLQNNNWVYMQNIYKPNSIATIKQFNATQFSNQYYLDKQFKVVESGYSNQPYWYRSNADTQECYRSEFAGSSGSSQYAYTNYKVPAPLSLINTVYPPGHSASGAIERFSNWPYIPSGSSESDSTGSANDYQLSLHHSNQNREGSSLVPYYYYSSSWNPESKYITGSYYNVLENGVYDMYSKFYLVAYSETVSRDSPGLPRRYQVPFPAGFSIDIYLIKNPITSSGYLDGGTIIASGSFTDTSEKNYYKTEASFAGFLQKNDRIFTKVVISNWKRQTYSSATYADWPTGDVFTFIYPESFYSEYESSAYEGSYCFNFENYPLFSSSYVNSSNILPLTEEMSTYFNVSGSTTFLPEITSSLYPLFGDVNYSTKIEVGDYIIFYYNGSDLGMNNSNIGPISRRIIDVIDDGITQKLFKVYPNMPDLVTAANINDYQKIAFIKKQPDESVVILQGVKRPGKTSYGFLVPQDIDPYILQNINTLQSSIQSQILDY